MFVFILSIIALYAFFAGLSFKIVFWKRLSVEKTLRGHEIDTIRLQSVFWPVTMPFFLGGLMVDKKLGKELKKDGDTK